jgi:uroporphyrinogen-III synthase
MVGLLEARGAEAIEAAMIRIAPPEDFGPLDAACTSVHEFDWIVFASANAVDVFIKRLLATPLDLRAMKGVNLCAVGPATAERLRELGLKVDLVPAEYRAEAVVEGLAGSRDITGVRVLLPRADIGREVVADELRRRGAEVTEVVAYRTVVVDPEREGEPDIYRMLLDRRIDVVTFTSASAVRNLVRVLGAEPAADLLGSTVVACIGPVTAEACGAVQHTQHHRSGRIHGAGAGRRDRRPFCAYVGSAFRRTWFEVSHESHSAHRQVDPEADPPPAAAALVRGDARDGPRNAPVARHVRAAALRLRRRGCPPGSVVDAGGVQPVGR